MFVDLREREKHQSTASHMSPNWGSNRQPFDAQDQAPNEPPDQGLVVFFIGGKTIESANHSVVYCLHLLLKEMLNFS